MEASAVLLLLVLVAGAVAGPTQWQASQSKCSTRCPESVKFKYESGLSYEYRYEAETRTTVAGAAEDTAAVTITATAKIEVLDSCDMALRLTDVAIKRSHEDDPKRMVRADDMSRARNSLEGRALRFAFYDGVVGDLCPDDDEEVWALNVKRGMLSAFQNSMLQMDREEHVQEVDVAGQCPTHYRVTQRGWKSLTITKAKDVLGCTHRHDHRTSLLSTPYSSPNSLQSLPLMKTSHECTQDVSKEAAILERSSCHEVHVFRPFSKVNSGAVTEASHTLTFRSKAPASRRSHPGPVSRRSTLLYEHRQGMAKGTSVFMDAKNKLKEICEATKVDIRPQVPRLFAELVHMMRSLDYSDLQDLSRQLERNRVCVDNSKKIKEFFQDALPMVATEASLRMMSGLLTSEEFSDAQATFWITSLAFVSNPTKDMISAVQPLLKDAKRQEDAMLAVSALVNNYCDQHADCTQHEEVLEVLDTLTTILGPDCQVQQDNFKQVLLTLRAIGNIGRSEAASLRLEKCFTHSDNPMDVRVAALDAYRRMPCSADRNDVMELFLRHSEDSELRIAAYLTVMQCPSDRVLAQVRQALQDEEVNQVGSFVWTHLTNLLETESPHKQAVRDVLENDLLQREFRKDRRKFSRNTEVSFFSGKFNVGGTYDSNLVWSQNSFLPRSAMMNLTVDMFGHSVNLLELGGRVQGLEDLLQTTFFGADHSGKEGGYGQTDVVKKAKLVRTKANYGNVKDDFRGQLYMRIFGNELAYGTVDKSYLKQLTGGKGKSFFEDLAKKLMSDGEVAFTQSAVFLDTTLIIPTVAGLPLNLTVNGSASLEVQASQKMNFKKISAKSKAFEVAGMLQPSGAVELASTMSVDALVTKVGLEMTSRLHSSTAMQGRVELARGQILSVEIDTPRDTLEILDFQSKFYIVHDGRAKEQRMLVPGRLDKRACSGQPLARVVGMELCASLSFPNATSAPSAPYFPLSGPTALTLTLTKHDAHSGYKLLAKQIQTSSSVITQVALDTPGSTVDRAISLGYVANLKAKTLEADLLSPWKKVSAQMSLTNTKKLTTADATVTIDSDTEFKVHAEVAKNIKNNKELIAKVKPSLEVTSNGAPLLSAKGSLDYRQNKMTKVNFVMDMKDVLRKPISLDYTLEKRERGGKLRYKNNVKLSSQFATVKSSVQGLVSTAAAQQKRSSLLALRARVDYNLHFWPKVKRNVVNLGLKLNDRSTAALAKYGINMNLDSKQVPEASLAVNGEVSHKKTLTKVEMKIRHGQNVKAKADKSKELLLAGFVAHKIADPQAVVSFDLKAIYPEKSIEYQLKGKHEHNKKEIEDYLTLRYAKGKSMDAHMRLAQVKKKRSATFDLSYPAGESYPARTVKLNADLAEKGADHHVLSAMASLQKGRKHSLVVSYKRPTDNSVDISSELNIHRRKPIKLDLSGNYALRDMKGQGTLTFEGDTYRLAYTSDIQKNRYANFTASFDHPERRVRATLEGGRDAEENVKRGKVEVLWDVDKDPSQKFGVTMEMADKAHPDEGNFGGMVEVFTPFQDYEHLKGELRLENSRKRFLAVAETVLGDRQKEYSAKFLLAKPVMWQKFKTQAWLKTPHPAVRHVEVKADHSFEHSGKLSTALKGTFNRHNLQMGVSGSVGGDGVVLRLMEGAAFFKSTLQGANNLRLTFNHRDTAGRYTTQALANVNGDQYSATMEADYTKVHYQITTNGEVNIRAPQLTSPVTVSWQHKNSLHEVTSSLTVQYPPDNQRVRLEVEGTANIVTDEYQAQVLLRGPWKENGGEHVSKLNVKCALTNSDYELTANLQLDKDTYDFHNSQKKTAAGLDVSTGLEMSRFPEYSYQYTYRVTYADFPYAVSFEAQLAKKTVLEIDIDIENPRNHKYRTTSRVVFSLDDVQQKIVATTRHEKNGRGQLINSGNIEYEAGKTISFNSLVDIERGKKMINLEVDTPIQEVRTIRLEYSHSGTVTEDFIASCSLTVAPLFDTPVSTEISWSRQDRFRGNLRVALPIQALPRLEVKTQSWMGEGGKRHSTLEVEFSPEQSYKLDTVYSCDFPRGFDVMVNISTPRPELPFLFGHVKYQYSGDEVTGLCKLASPAMQYDELSVSFNHRQGQRSFTSQVDSVIGSGNVWTTRTEISWDDEIDGLFSMENNGKGRQKMALLLSHKGYTYEDFRTKASFKMNGDRLESELAYSNRGGREGLFMLATPDPDIDYFKITFSERLTEDKSERRFTVQYGEAPKPHYDLGLMMTYSGGTTAFSIDLKTPHSEDLGIEIGFARRRRVELKLFGKYGSRDKINVLVKYNIRNEFWDVGGDFEYMVKGSGRNIGFLFKRDGPLDNLKCTSTAKYMGKEITVDAHYKDAEQKTGRVDVLSNFKDYTSLAASFNHSRNSENFRTDIYLKYKDDKEARGSVDFQRNKWKRIQITTTLNLPYEDFQENTLTYKQVNRKNKVSAEGSLKLGSARAINGNLDFVDSSKLTVSVTGPYKDFVSFTATGTYDEADKRMEGDASVQLTKGDPITATYMVRAGIWPVMVNVKAQTPFEGWESVELTSTHDGVLTDFTSSYSLTSDFLGTVQSELIWTYTSPSALNGLWTMTSRLDGAENLKLSLKNTQLDNSEYTSHLIVGWELLKEIVVDTTVELPDSDSSNRYKGKLAMTTPLPEASQVSVSFDHNHDDRLIQDAVIAHFNDRKYLDADFTYTVGDRRVGRVEFREPRPMEFLLGGGYSESAVEGELKLNWDKRDPVMNIHLMGDYANQGDHLGNDTNMKVWAIHPARTMGVEYLMKRAPKEFQSDFLLTWDKSSGQTLSYVINWTDRSSRYSSAYDAMVKVGVPMRSVQVEGAYSDTGRVRAAEGWLMWDADRDKNMKLGVKGQLDKRGNSNQLQLGLDLPFISKEYSMTTEATVNDAGSSTLLDARTEFSYSPDPRRVVVVTARLDDLSYGQEATANYSLALGLVHPMTDLDVHLTSHVGSSPGRSSAAGSLVYMLSRTREKKVMALRGEVDRLRRVLGVELTSPVKNVSLEGQLTGDQDYNVQLVSNNNGQRSQVAHIFINPQTRTLETTFWYDKESPGSSVKLFGHLVDDRLLQTELYRMDGGQRVSETLMTVRLNSSHLLHTRLNWRPDMLRDLQQYIGTQLTVFSYGSSAAFQSVAGAVGSEVMARYQAIMEEVKEEARPLFEHFQRDMETLQADLDSLQTGLRRFYYQNALHVQDMSSAINEILKALVDGLQGVGLRFRQLQSQWQQDLTQLMQTMGQYPLAQKYAQLVADFAGGLKNSRVVLEQALDHLSAQVATFSNVTYRRYLLISRQIDRKMQGYTAALRHNPHYQGLARLGGHLSSGNYRQLAQAANARLLEALDELGLKEPYLAVVGRAKRVIADQFQDLVQRPEFQQIYVIGSELYQQSVWAYHYWQVEKNMQLAVGQVLKLAKDVTLLEITRIKDAVVDLDKSRVIVFDPQHGELQFEIHLPVALKSLAEPPDMRVTKYINRVRAWAATYIPSPSHSLWTAINSYLPSTDTDTWLPPFTAHAFVMGDQHVVTFDRRHYNFAGRCSYILARDMADDRFTVVLKYNNRPRQPQVESVVVLLRGVALEVDRDNKVKVNRKETELPFFSGVISAVRQQSVVRVQDGQALTVEIDSARGIYSVALSGWYHGRTAGLLGTYDNEPFNDLTDSKHQLTEDVEAFSNSWEVGHRFCRSRNLADMGQLDAEDEDVAACSRFLTDSSSYFSPCFGQVEAKELVSVCVSLVRSAGVSQQEAQCRAGQHYRYMCGRLGIGLGTPVECVSCQLPGVNGRLGAGEKRMLERGGGEESGAGGDDPQGGRSADVVFVVEESACNAWAQRFLPSVATQLSQALTAQGLTANRFGMVSYAGNGSHDLQLVHTIEGQVFGDPGDFLKAAENLRLTYPSQPGDVEAALREAVQYPFRVGAAKVLVLLPCSPCAGDLYALGQVLRSHGFTLHVLSEQNFAFASAAAGAGGSPNASPVRVFGVDNSRAHTPKSAARRSADIYQRLELPAGSCSRLALATNGSVFDVGHLQARSRVQKEFLRAFAARGALGARPPQCERCSCHDDGTGRGHTVCQLCDDGNAWMWDHIPRWLQSSSSGVMGVFNDLHHQIITSLDAPEVVKNA